MGVSAVFVSTLARTRLPSPADPPANEQEMLAATIQTIVSFVVLGSIFIRVLSSATYFLMLPDAIQTDFLLHSLM